MKLIKFACAAACLLALAACAKGKKQEKITVAVIRPKVAVEKIIPGRFAEKVSFTGFLKPSRKADLAPGMPGKVEKILVHEGDRVAAGQLLAEMDNTQLSTMENNYGVAKANYERMKELFQNKAIPQSQFEQVESGYKTAEVTLKSMRSNTQITAPFNSVVTAVAREAGEMYSPGMAMPGAPAGLIQVMDLASLLLEIQVSEKHIALIRQGQKVQISIQVLPDQVFTGEVDWINPAADYSSHTFTVSIKLPNASGLLKPGYFGEVEIMTRQKDQAVSVPRSAVLSEKFAFVLLNDSTAVRRAVSLGLVNRDRVEITSGLEAGETVVIKGNKVLGDTSLVMPDTAAAQ